MKFENCKADFQNKYYEVMKSVYFTPMYYYKHDENWNLQFDFSYRIINIEPSTNPHESYTGALEFSLKCCPENYPQKLVLDVVVFGIFSGTNVDEKTFTTMLELNGLTFLSQIMRSHILMATSGTGGKQIALPLINIPKIIEAHHEANLAE